MKLTHVTKPASWATPMEVPEEFQEQYGIREIKAMANQHFLNVDADDAIKEWTELKKFILNFFSEGDDPARVSTEYFLVHAIAEAKSSRLNIKADGSIIKLFASSMVLVATSMEVENLISTSNKIKSSQRVGAISSEAVNDIIHIMMNMPDVSKMDFRHCVGHYLAQKMRRQTLVNPESYMRQFFFKNVFETARKATREVASRRNSHKYSDLMNELDEQRELACTNSQNV